MEDSLMDNLDLLVLPDTDNSINTDSKAFLTDNVPNNTVIDYNILCPMYSRFMGLMYPIYREDNIPILGIGNAALVLAAQLGCKLHDFVAGHDDKYHRVGTAGTKNETQVYSNHVQGIARLGSNMETLAHAIDKNGVYYMPEAFKSINMPVAGILWKPDVIANTMTSKNYGDTGHMIGDPISFNIIKSLLNGTINL